MWVCNDRHVINHRECTEIDITPTTRICLSTSKEEGWLFDELSDQGNDDVKAMEISVIFSGSWMWNHQVNQC